MTNSDPKNDIDENNSNKEVLQDNVIDEVNQNPQDKEEFLKLDFEEIRSLYDL
jgi:hypothetical protein